MEKLQGLVEASRVGRSRRADGKQPFDVSRKMRTRQGVLACSHPVLVALDGVDLPVVGDETVRVGQGPRRERVRGEPRMDEADGRCESVVGEIEEEIAELGCGQHPLVDEGATRQGGEVGERLPGVVVELVLDPFAGCVHGAVEIDPRRSRVGGRHEELSEGRHDSSCGRTDVGRVRIDRNISPPQNRQILGLEDLRHTGRGVVGVVTSWQECQPDRVVAGIGEVEVHDAAKEHVGNLHENPRSVTAVGLRSGSPSVIEVAQRGQGTLQRTCGWESRPTGRRRTPRTNRVRAQRSRGLFARPMGSWSP